MKKSYWFAILLTCNLLFIPQATFAGEHSLGIGAHYFYTLDDIRTDLEDDLGDSYHRDGLALCASYKYKPNDHFGFLAEVQGYPDGYYDAKTALSSRLFLLLGKGLYAGAGIAWNYISWENETDLFHDSDGWTDPYYILRVGMEIPILTDSLKLDINANYEMNEWNDFDEFDTDALTFGAGVRIAF